MCESVTVFVTLKMDAHNIEIGRKLHHQISIEWHYNYRT